MLAGARAVITAVVVAHAPAENAEELRHVSSSSTPKPCDQARRGVVRYLGSVRLGVQARFAVFVGPGPKCNTQ